MRPIHLKPVSVSSCGEAVGGGHRREQRRRHDRVRVDAARPALVQPPAEQPAHLVAAQHPVRRSAGGAAVARRHRDRAPVGVGVVGDHDVGVGVDALLEREVHRARLLGVGERHGGELGVGRELRGHHARRREAGEAQRLEHDVAAHAVHRRVGDPHLARGRRVHQRGDVGEVRRQHVVAERLPAVAARHVAHRAHGVDRSADLGVGRRDDLGAVAEVDLVAVVLRRVVARGDHDAGGAAEVADRVREHRRRQRPRQDVGVDARALHDLGGVAGERVGLVAGVVPDDDRAPGAAAARSRTPPALRPRA